MNDLGLALAWLAFRVACLLAPALLLQGLASRRGPACGARVATWSLTLAAGLGVVACFGGLDPGRWTTPRESQRAPVVATNQRAVKTVDSGRAHETRGWSMALGLPKAWERIGRARAPVVIAGRWGRGLALAALACIGLGLSRLALGLWAIRVCRIRGGGVDDPALLRLVEELRGAMGCRRPVRVLEVPDLATPATAGWLRPLLLLPPGWRGWAPSERRAVVAHELAHVIRNDYAAGLMAKFAVALNCQHPLVRRMAARLHMEQELAADALGARFAGGHASYLLALSRLALEQDSRPTIWPARAFLPARGTLIRRIAMLKDTTVTDGIARDWSRSRRYAAALGLLALAACLACWKAPARAADAAPGSAPAKSLLQPLELRFLPPKSTGVVAVRPAALAGRKGMETLTSMLVALNANDLDHLIKELKIDTANPGYVEIRCEDIESVVAAFDIGVAAGGQKRPDGQKLHTMIFGGVTVRAVKSFDWPDFFAQRNLDLDEIKVPGGSYYKIRDPKKSELFMGCCLYLPDDRTLVFEDEETIRGWVGRDDLPVPDYVRGDDWKRASRGVFAVALDNREDSLAKDFDLGRPDDAMVLPMFRGVDRWVLSVPATDDISPHAEAVVRDARSAVLLVREVEHLVKIGRTALALTTPLIGERARASRFADRILENLKIVRANRTILLDSPQSGTFAEVGAMLSHVVADATARAKAQTASASPKAERR